MTPQQSADAIRDQVARAGFVGRAAMRLYLDSRLTRLQFSRATARGLELYRAAHEGEAGPPPGGYAVEGTSETRDLKELPDAHDER